MIALHFKVCMEGGGGCSSSCPHKAGTPVGIGLQRRWILGTMPRMAFISEGGGGLVDPMVPLSDCCVGCATVFCLFPPVLAALLSPSSGPTRGAADETSRPQLSDSLFGGRKSRAGPHWLAEHHGYEAEGSRVTGAAASPPSDYSSALVCLCT